MSAFESHSLLGVGTCEPALRFRRIAQQHALWRHPFVERCRAGELTLAQVRVLGGQMYKFSSEFTCFLAKALASCRDEQARLVIGQNLWEELGEGDPDRAHPELFRRFTRALRISDRELLAIPAEPETTQLIDTYLGLSDRYGELGLIGALCFASEGIVAGLYSQIETGLLKAVAFDKADLAFFEVHIHVDDGHAQNLESILLPRLRGAEDVERTEAAIGAALDARCRFFDGVLRAAAS